MTKVKVFVYGRRRRRQQQRRRRRGYDNSSRDFRHGELKSMYFEKFSAKIAPKRRALCDVTKLLLMTSLAKEHETAVKSVM